MKEFLQKCLDGLKWFVQTVRILISRIMGWVGFTFAFLHEFIGKLILYPWFFAKELIGGKDA